MSEVRSLSDWETLCAYIRETYQDVTVFAAELIRFRVQKGETSTWVKLRTLSLTEPMWIYFLTKVCPEAQVDPRAILHRSGVTPIGELSLFGDFVVFGQRVPLAGLNSETVSTIVDTLVTERMLIVKELVKSDAEASTAFSHLTE